MNTWQIVAATKEDAGELLTLQRACWVQEALANRTLSIPALHESLDMMADPVTTDAQGEAVVRLPRGPWLLDLASADPAAGRTVFARVRFAVRGEGRQSIVLDAVREVQLRTAKGDLRTAHVMTLAWPDFSFRTDVEAHEGRRRSPYRCTAGKLTIGVGHNLDDVPLSDEAIDVIFRNDLEAAEAGYPNTPTLPARMRRVRRR